MGRLTTAVMVSLWAIPVSMLLNRIVPQPYMDEIFHIPQAQQYCQGNFQSWDPMITTPPGLYGLSLAYIASLFPGKWILNLSQSDLCTTPILRSTNVVLAIICSILVRAIVMHLRPGMTEGKATLYAIFVGLYPVHWFFTFLYYTDVASLAAVLAMYLSCLKKNFWFSAMFGAVAVLCRQTNIIWVIFVAANGAISLIGDIIAICKTFWYVKWRVLVAFTPFAFVLAAFGAFVFLNGGIVLGAKEAHVVSPHFSQILYFGLVSAAAAFPLHFSPNHAKPNFFFCFLTVKFFKIVFEFSSIAHPYLLADNRHYTFYIWRRLIQAHWSIKYALIPLYVYSWFSILTTLGKEQKSIWVLSYCISVALVLVPAPLIEFRYFTIPLVLLIIHSPIMSQRNLLLLSFVYAVVNALTMALFLFRPFHWAHEHGTQRFMW
ncbi:Dol-P-Glc:Glc(2)Man(9)GlcNAc(2)-PP-Dol [Carex littledalei]|uniref:Dol-P-Glc:Glc(2)Man(9)GlcNAc(2)-PP-Dol alpha-1,2-glucosyltransferase n=1 Tax=Carex littledalei TaxID=544730 RepID=A0A833REI2_9POAL|nr:Dol-P-Glc:Glc(2)Man(9)GlcNAc(2)-PP-Dol [Carex littledalei]